MIKAIFAFFIFTGFFYFGINAWRKLANKERWELTKTISYATMCSLLAIVALAALVILF